MRLMKVRSIVINQPDSPSEHNRAFESRFYRYYSAINGDHGGGLGSRQNNMEYTADSREGRVQECKS